MDSNTIQILRTIDKFDRIGRDGVVELLQKPESEFGAGLDPIQAGLVGLFLDTKGSSDAETIDNLNAWFDRAAKVRRRVDLMVALDDRAFSDGTTAWDRLLNMPQNADETWTSGGRPQNIAWALDDIVAVLSRGGGEHGN